MMHILIEEQKIMKYLKIEENKGFYLKSGTTPSWIEIDKINKDDLMELLNLAIISDFEMDQFKEEIIQNKAHQIIYKNIYEKFTSLISQKNVFKDQSESLYKEAIEKYSNKG
jgi:hypothetical protein